MPKYGSSEAKDGPASMFKCLSMDRVRLSMDHGNVLQMLGRSLVAIASKHQSTALMATTGVPAVELD